MLCPDACPPRFEDVHGLNFEHEIGFCAGERGNGDLFRAGLLDSG